LFQKLNAITKRVAKFEPVVTRYGDAVFWFYPGGLQLFAATSKIVHEIGDVCLCSRSVDIVLHSHMYLAAADLQPESAPAGEACGLRYLGQPEYAAVKGPGFILGSNGNTYLSMVYGLYHG
jgi:hypothetical protein